MKSITQLSPFKAGLPAILALTILAAFAAGLSCCASSGGSSVSTALPCRIAICEEGGKTMLATLKPTTLLALFNTPQLNGVAQAVEDTIVKIMKKAAKG